MTLKLPTTSFNDRAVNALALDINGVLMRLMPTRVLSFAAQYREPMHIALESQPLGLYAMRIREESAPEDVVNHGTRVSWTWDGTRGARIDAIEGMTPGATRYLFDLEVVG